MNFLRRATRVALIAWAFYLTVALTAFALHVHSPQESGAPTCALCVGHNITGAVSAVAAFTVATPMLLWSLRLWLTRPQSAWVTPIARADDTRGPPAKVFSLPPI